MNIGHIINNQLNEKGNQFIVAVSGGVDSMVLLDVISKNPKYKIIVAHVNYNLRTDSIMDEELVEDYCLKKNIPFYKKRIIEHLKGNIQAQARAIRYKFFQEIANKTNINRVLVAHHLDDHIETYMLQTQRDILVENYGLKKLRNIFNIEVYRPMLQIEKEQIKLYARINKVEWREDSSNNENKYERNIIRRNIIDQMSWIKKKFVIKKINYLNKKNKRLFKKVFNLKEQYIKDNKIDLTLFDENLRTISIILYWYLKTNKYPINRINKKIIGEIISFNRKTIQVKASLDLAKDFKFIKNYNKYYIIKGEK